MKAITMFKKEGYELVDNEKENYADYAITYRTTIPVISGIKGEYDLSQEISFDTEFKNIDIYTNDEQLPLSIDKNLLKAINKQCEELGWL